MLTYATLQDRPREFLAATALTHDELTRVLPAFAAAYRVLYPPDKTWEGKQRPRQSGGGATGGLPPMADQLLCILVYHKTHPLQPRHGWHCELSHPQTTSWMHPVLPVWPQACTALGVAPEREARRGATRALACAGAPEVALDGTERRRHRPPAAAPQQEPSSGTKHTQTAKHILRVHEPTTTGLSLGPTVAGKKHDKQAADAGALA